MERAQDHACGERACAYSSTYAGSDNDVASDAEEMEEIQGGRVRTGEIRSRALSVVTAFPWRVPLHPAIFNLCPVRTHTYMCTKPQPPQYHAIAPQS